MLEQSQELFDLLMDSTSTNIVLYRAIEEGADFEIIAFNKGAEQTDFISKSELIGKRLTEIFPGVDEFGLLDVLRRVYHTGESERFDDKFYSDDRISGWRNNEVKRLSDGHIIVFYEDKTELKQAEDHLLSLGKVMENSLSEVYIYEQESLRFTYANKSAQRNTGYTLDELHQMKHHDITPEFDFQQCHEFIAPLQEGLKEQLFLETTHLRKDGSIYNVKANLQMVKKDGIDQIIVLLSDTTEHKLADAKLKASQENLARAEQVANLGTWEWDIVTNDIKWSDQTYKIFGESPQSFDMTLEMVFQYIPEEEHSAITEAIERAISHHERYEIDYPIVLRDGSTRYVRAWGEVLFTPEGRPYKMWGAILDITEKYFLRNQLSQQKELYERLFHNSSDGVCLIENGLLIDCNEALIKRFGYRTKEDVINRPPTDFSPEFQPDGEQSSLKIEQTVGKTFSEGQQRFEWVHQKADGNTLWNDVLFTHIITDGKNLIYGVIRDISDRKAMEQELESLTTGLQKRVEEEVKKNQQQASYMLQQSRLAQMGEMISMIAHQWRQPLASISAITGTLSLDVVMDNYKKTFFAEHLDTIGQLSQHLSSTIDDFRDFFRETKEKTTSSCTEMLQGSLSIIEPSLTSKNITLYKDLKSDHKLLTYPNEIKQVLLNILKNADDALIDNGVEGQAIWIAAYALDDRSIITIEDNAGGIPEEIMEKIFDPYFTTKTKKDGTGLGLYMSKTIIEEHCKGKLWVENSELGAKFIIELPH